MPARVAAHPLLTARELNRAVLARQLLLDRVSLPIPAAIERVAGLQTQYAPSGYVALFSRLVDFRRDALTEALVDRSVVQGTLMRSTIHTVSAADYPLFAAGIRGARRAWFLRAWGKDVEGVDLDEVAAFVRSELAGGPRRQKDLEAAVTAHGWPRLAWVGVASAWLDMVRVPPSGTWERRKADMYGLADEWLGLREAPRADEVREPTAEEGAAPAPAPSEAEGVDHLLRRYLEGFGPAPLREAAAWAGVPVTVLAPAVERLDRSIGLRRFSDEQRAELLDLPDAPLPGPDVAAPVRFLPTWETMLLAHARRAAVLPEPYRPLVFNTRTPHSVESFTVDGCVAGTWKYDKGRVTVTPFEPLAPAAAREVEAEAERLAAFHA